MMSTSLSRATRFRIGQYDFRSGGTDLCGGDNVDLAERIAERGQILHRRQDQAKPTYGSLSI